MKEEDTKYTIESASSLDEVTDPEIKRGQRSTARLIATFATIWTGVLFVALGRWINILIALNPSFKVNASDVMVE